MNDRQEQQWQQALSGILQEFQQGTIPEAIALALFPEADVPSARWSLTNRLLMVLAGTQDARGIKQWNAVGRRVKKGAKALRIFAPRIIRVKAQKPAEPLEDQGEENQEQQKLVGFLLIPVFRVEDTEGEPLGWAWESDLPLLEVALAWGLEAKAIPGNVAFYGSFRASTSEISLASPEEKVFFHRAGPCRTQSVGPSQGKRPLAGRGSGGAFCPRCYVASAAGSRMRTWAKATVTWSGRPRK